MSQDPGSLGKHLHDGWASNEGYFRRVVSIFFQRTTRVWLGQSSDPFNLEKSVEDERLEW